VERAFEQIVTRPDPGVAATSDPNGLAAGNAATP